MKNRYSPRLQRLFRPSAAAQPRSRNSSLSLSERAVLRGFITPQAVQFWRLVNKSRRTHGIRCAVDSTGGSVCNLNTMKAGEVEFGVARSDWNHHACNGPSSFADNPFPELRSVFFVHPAPFTLIVRGDRGIGSFKGIRASASTFAPPALRLLGDDGDHHHPGDPETARDAACDLISNCMCNPTGWRGSAPPDLPEVF